MIPEFEAPGRTEAVCSGRRSRYSDGALLFLHKLSGLGRRIRKRKYPAPLPPRPSSGVDLDRVRVYSSNLVSRGVPTTKRNTTDEDKRRKGFGRQIGQGIKT